MEKRTREGKAFSGARPDEGGKRRGDEVWIKQEGNVRKMI